MIFELAGSAIQKDNMFFGLKTNVLRDEEAS